MATLQQIAQSGTDYLISGNPLPDPLHPPDNINIYLNRFDPDIYNRNLDSHLVRFMTGLLGDAGVGTLKKQMLYPKLQSYINSTYFTDLDILYGNPLLFPRLSTEVYSVDPKGEALTFDQWIDVWQKDAAYKTRCLIWMRALMAGASPEGIKLAAEAATGVECQILERYKYLQDHTFPNIGQTQTYNELVIIPQTTLTVEEKYKIMKLTDLLRPIDSIVTVSDGTVPKHTVNIASVSSTSDFFYVKQFVTGTSGIDWPDVDTSKGYWITAGEETEAPVFAFMNTQETALFVTILSATVSSFHVGQFNTQQQSLFAHLSNIPINYAFEGSNALANQEVVYKITNPWLPKSTGPLTIVNNFYPIQYFNLSSLTYPAYFPYRFWASNEDLVDTDETLIIDFGVTQLFNTLSFEISHKPIDMTFEYSTDNVTWTPLVQEQGFLNSQSVPYIPSNINPWEYYEDHFEAVQARFVRITFSRRESLYAIGQSVPYPYSIEVRNLRALYSIATAGDLLYDNSNNVVSFNDTDPFGNALRTDVATLDSSKVIDGNTGSFWQSQPNPSPLAVECLYFDLRKNGAAQIISEILIDPLTIGPKMHIYFSSDESTDDMDSKLWTPINENFILKRGFIHLQRALSVKFVKFEFTALNPIPYSSLEFPKTPPITYRKFPSWIVDLFNTYYPQSIDRDSLLFPFTQVSIDIIPFGYDPPVDLLDAGSPISPPILNPETEITTAIQEVINQKNLSTLPLAKEIKFHSSFMWQEDILSQLDDSTAIGRFVKRNQDTLAPDQTIDREGATPPPLVQNGQTIPDTRTSEVEKKVPDMYFPFNCRHGYQILEATRDTKVAYVVGIREISFWRRDYTVLCDEEVITDTLDDTQSIAYSDFVQNDWRYELIP